MIGPSPADRAIDDARALLDTLLASGWDDIHVAAEGVEIFIARRGGRENPMRARADMATGAARDVETTTREVSAPHVATLLAVEAVGSFVAAGARIATLRVLDEERQLIAPGAGVVAAWLSEPGDLLEYGTPVVMLREATR